jgi:prevent-host-death family protein
MGRRWQLQEAKQRLSELIRAVERDGPQFVTRHGRAVAVIVDIDEYRNLVGADDLKSFLISGPDLDELEIERDDRLARAVDLP